MEEYHPINLHLPDRTPTKNWACGKCKRIAHSKEAAVSCCKPVLCKSCGDPCERPWLKCRSCREIEFAEREQKAWDAAEPVEVSPMWVHEDRFFEDDVEYVEDVLADGGDVPMVYATKPTMVRLMAEDLIYQLLEDVDSDYHPNFRAEQKELQDLLDAWQEKHREMFTFYFEDSTKKSAYADKKMKERE